VVLKRLSEALTQGGIIDSTSLFTPNNWRLLVFGLALVLMMRWRPEGLFPFRSLIRESEERPQTA
jgi:ABC-type branched-subunit amino acid transport system permease subunit